MLLVIREYHGAGFKPSKNAIASNGVAALSSDWQMQKSTHIGGPLMSYQPETWVIPREVIIDPLETYRFLPIDKIFLDFIILLMLQKFWSVV